MTSVFLDPAARICLENQQQFPQIQPLQTSGASYSVLFPSPGSTPGSESLVSPTSALEPSSDGSIASSCSENSLSFAQVILGKFLSVPMARLGKYFFVKNFAVSMKEKVNF